MTDFRKPSASTEDRPSPAATTDSKKKPYVPIEHRPLLGVPEVEALTGIPAKIIRANVRNGLLKARMAGSTTMRIRRVDLDAWLGALPAWHE
ncbi:helix-turn-helix domain-containing protein [Bifidobacterium moukalabense]|uniref:helix-turn-helix domain-containing protein n=1 Tax=Bifidobacterium moukalabense TaxID=1333651 RepID=UPI0010F60B81|nr:helix-turn-helix domain-containing protein [Bifidobacterium moukalabense]